MHRRGPGELLVGQVADLDHEVTVVPDVADMARPQPGQRHYLSSVDPAWAAKVGTGKTLRWPTGEGAEGNSGVAVAVNRTGFSVPPASVVIQGRC